MTSASPSTAGPSSLDVFSAYLYSGASLYAAGRTLWSAKKFIEDPSLEKGGTLFVDALYFCASTVTFLFTANKVKWLSVSISHKFERTLNFSSMIIRTISGEHPLKLKNPAVDPHPLVRVAYMVSAVAFAILEIVTLFYANSVTNALYYTFMVINFTLLGVGIYLANADAPPGAAPNAAPATA